MSVAIELHRTWDDDCARAHECIRDLPLAGKRSKHVGGDLLFGARRTIGIKSDAGGCDAVQVWIGGRRAVWVLLNGHVHVIAARANADVVGSRPIIAVTDRGRWIHEIVRPYGHSRA